MKNIYALRGIHDSGKTETMKILRNTLIKKYGLKPKQIQDFSQNSNEIQTILSGVKGLKIGIESQGDPNSRLDESLEFFEEEECNIIFCACRTSGMTVEWIESCVNYKIEFIKQTFENDSAKRTASNTNMANFLIGKAGL